MEWIKVIISLFKYQLTGEQKMIKAPYGKISHITISTILGHGGFGMFPYVFYPNFWVFMLTVWIKNTTIIAKSATRYRRHGNFIWWNPWTWRFVHRIPGEESILNSFGLTNPGILICAIMIRIALMLGFNVIPSFFTDFSKGYAIGLKETLEALRIYKKILGKHFWALESNPSCPNSGEDILNNQVSILHLCQAIKREYPNLILIVKGSIVYQEDFYSQLEKAGVNIIHAMNTIPFDFAVKLGISPYAKSPLGEKTKGGYSGKIISDAAFDYAKTTVIPTTSIPLIFGGGISGFSNMCKYDVFLVNQKDYRDYSFAICTTVAYDPIKAAKLIWKF
jgi:dihydroorotate dehydrogenase